MKEKLLKYLKGERVHPAILLVGPDPKNKWEAAILMAQTLMCLEKNRPCEKCKNCLRIAKEYHPDVLILKEEEEPVIKIETIREITYQMTVPPLEGHRKICIIQDCDRMNPAASNAFLKTLEEPGENRFFILLTTKPSDLLPTILSRVIEFHFKPERKEFAMDESLQNQFLEIWKQFCQNKNPMKVSQELPEKENTLEFLKFIQKELRNSCLNTPSVFSNFSKKDMAKKFEKVMEAENCLRSNASHTLILESLLREQFTQPNT